MIDNAVIMILTTIESKGEQTVCSGLQCVHNILSLLLFYFQGEERKANMRLSH